jgi:hypothetical protein
MLQRSYLLLAILVLCGTLFRFYNLFWGAPFYFHPDERNIANAITQLQLPNQMNPHFFAYGSLPIYLSFFGGLLYLTVSEWRLQNFVSFDLAIQTLRSISAFFSVLLIPLLFFAGKKLQNDKTGLIAALLGATSIGLIQFAHFGTFEMSLTILSLLLFLNSLLYIQKPSFKKYLGISTIFALLVCVKISSLSLLPLVILPLILLRKHEEKWLQKSILSLSMLGIVSSILYLITNPFALIDFQSFKDSITYETEVATGELPVFYTGEFFNTNSFSYHVLNVYPFLLNPLILLVFIPSFFFLVYLFAKHKKPAIVLLLLWFLLSFLPQTILFVKWTRYVIPTLPFIYLIIALSLSEGATLLKQKHPILVRKGIPFGIGLVTSVCFLYAYSYTHTAFIQTDSRVQALMYAKMNIPTDARLLSEVYDLGITPFNEQYPAILLFNFYDLEHQPDLRQQLEVALRKSDYLILPSQRLLKTRIMNPNTFPIGHAFYTDLLQGNTDFRKIYETPCDIWCKITYWNEPIFGFEQTTNIFDRPVVVIFKNDQTN